jgi:hypothetical protein
VHDQDQQHNEHQWQRRWYVVYKSSEQVEPIGSPHPWLGGFHQGMQIPTPPYRQHIQMTTWSDQYNSVNVIDVDKNK